MQNTLRTSQVSGVLDLWERGDASARGRLMAYIADRLRSLASVMLRNSPVRRWEQPDDLLQQALVRVDRALHRARPTDSRALLELASLEMRHALIDLFRHYFGPCGQGSHHHSNLGDPQGAAGLFDMLDGQSCEPLAVADRAESFERLYAAIDTLPKDEREVVDLVGIHQLTQPEAAALLGVTLKTVGRRWRRARLRLAQVLQDQPV